MVRQVRHLIHGPLPIGHLNPGEVILAPPRRFRRSAALWSSVSTLLTTMKGAMPEVLRICRNGRSVRVKWEQVWAELWLKATNAVYSAERLHRPPGSGP
jgi:hypothetical protein